MTELGSEAGLEDLEERIAGLRQKLDTLRKSVKATI